MKQQSADGSNTADSIIGRADNQKKAEKDKGQASSTLVEKKYKFCLLPGNNSTVFKKILLARNNWEEIKENQSEEKAIFLNSNFIWKSYNFEVRTLNHFENNRGMCTKTGLIRSLSSYYRHLDQAVIAKYSVFDTCSTSFVLTAGLNDVEFSTFLQRFNELEQKNYQKEKVPKKHCQENIWLLKPADANQGRGIEILKTQKEIIASLVAKTSHSYWVIQKYIEKPLLYHGRKFDIRMWVLVTRAAEIFYYGPGYIRTCSDEYVITDIDPNLHLTNNFVQKHHSNYGQHEPGNTLPIQQLFDYIDETFKCTDGSLKEKITQRMKDLIIDTVLASKKSMIQPKKYNTFEFFGYDFLIDEDLRVWLIEVNTNPYIGIPNEFISKLVPQMAEDLVQIAIDPVFPPANLPSDRQNDFELIYCENGSTFNNGQPKNIRSPFYSSVYPISKLAQKPNRVTRQILQSTYSAFQAKSPSPEDQDDVAASPVPNSKSLYFYQPILPQLRALSSPAVDSTGKSSREHRSSNRIIPRNNNYEKMQVLEQNEEDQYEETNNSNNNNNTNPKQGKQQSQQSYDPNSMYSNLKKLMSTYPYADFEPYYPHVSNIVSKMLNWELMSEHELKVVIKTFRLIINSRVVNVLAEQKYVHSLTQIIDSQNHPLELQQASLEALAVITKSLSNKLRVVSKEIITLLVKISMCSCEEKEAERFDKRIRVLAMNCLIQLGGIYNRKMYIPGETRDNDKIRKILIQNGGLLALLHIKKRAICEDVKRIATEFVDNLDISDFELQLNLLKKWKQNQSFDGTTTTSGTGNNSQQQNSENINQKEDQVAKMQESLIVLPFFSSRKNLLVSKDYKSTQQLNPLNINLQQSQIGSQTMIPCEFPSFLLSYSTFDIESSLNITNEMYEKLREIVLKREKEEKLKRELEEQKQLGIEEEKRALLLERKARVEQFVRRKEEEKMRRLLLEKKKEEKDKEEMAIESKRREERLFEIKIKRENVRTLRKIDFDKQKYQETQLKKIQEQDIVKRQQNDIARLKRHASNRVSFYQTTTGGTQNYSQNNNNKSMNANNNNNSNTNNNQTLINTSSINNNSNNNNISLLPIRKSSMNISNNNNMNEKQQDNNQEQVDNVQQQVDNIQSI